LVSFGEGLSRPGPGDPLFGRILPNGGAGKGPQGLCLRLRDLAKAADTLFLLATEGGGWEPGPAELRQAVSLLSLRRGLDKRLGALEAPEGRLGEPGRGFLLYLSLSLGLSLRHALDSAPTLKGIPLEALLVEFRKLARLKVGRQSILTRASPTVLEALGALGLPQERLDRMREGKPPLQVRARRSPPVPGGVAGSRAKA
jgi:hypothetical protein